MVIFIFIYIENWKGDINMILYFQTVYFFKFGSNKIPLDFYTTFYNI